MSEAAAETRTFGRSAGLLSAGVGTAGILTYAYFALASHQLDADSYGQIVLLWSSVFLAISIFYRPVEQLLSRTIAERRALGAEIGSALRVAATIQLGVAAAWAVLILAARDPLQNDLLSGSEGLYWVMFGSVIAFAASFYARGYLAGRRRFGLMAALLVCESASRTAFALAVALGIASGQLVIALGIVAAPCFSLLVVPLAFTRRVADDPVGAPVAESRVSLATGGRFASAVLIVMLSEQVFLNSPPLIGGIDADATAGYVFNILMIARAPLLVFQGVSTSLLPHLTRMRARGVTGEEAFRLSVSTTLRAIAAFAAAVMVIVAIAGPKLMQIAFSDKFSYDRLGLLMVAAGMGLYLAATTLNQAALAQGRARAAAVRWAACAAAFLVWLLIPSFDFARRTELGFLGAAIVLTATLAVLYRRAPEPDGYKPGSIDELSAQLATADEAS
ncbi:MAG: lipopolysaccharide biosynthesis protein [Solirubrobacterales bacterium]